MRPALPEGIESVWADCSLERGGFEPSSPDIWPYFRTLSRIPGSLLNQNKDLSQSLRSLCAFVPVTRFFSSNIDSCSPYAHGIKKTRPLSVRVLSKLRGDSS
jgi:hypothetical protein